jgi:polyisoprenyl-teichoic acid--peptidoglycan teichoic acid transferase
MRRSWPQRLVIALGVVLTMSCLAAASAVGYVYWKLGKLVHFDDLTVAEAAPEDPKNYLIVGSDSRDNIDPSDPDYDTFLGEATGGGKRSDTVMLLRVDPEAGTAALLSFPRDLWVEIAGTGEHNRINTAYGQGRQVLIDTIHQNFGIDVHHYIEVDFRGFQGVVSAIGGVPLWFDTAMRDTNSGLYVETPGCVVLDGDQALSFARARHLEYRTQNGRWAEDPTGDLGRITRQQVFVRRAIDRAVSEGISNPVTLNRLLDVAIENVGVDENLDSGDLINLARQFEQFTGEDLQTYTLPVVNDRTSAGASIVRLVEREAQPTLNVFRGLPPGAVTEADVVVEVRNGSGVAHQARDARDALEAVGFVPGATGDAGEAFARTTVRYATGSEAAADLLVRHLTSGAALEVDDSLDPNVVVLVTGADFTTIYVTPAPTSSTTEPPATTTSTTAAVDASTSSSTTTTVIGVAPGETPPGVDCG